MTTPKDPITCHVLDTTTGRPAAGIKVVLNVIDAQQYKIDLASVFHGTTDGDGRILNWTVKGMDGTVQPAVNVIQRWITDVKEEAGTAKDSKSWSLTFDTDTYYGSGVAFFHEVELKFRVQPGQHFHVSAAGII